MFNNLKLYQKVLIGFLIIIVIVSFFMLLALEKIKADLIENKKIELIKTTQLAGKMAESLFDTSIQNYLRGITETHLNTLNYYYKQHKEGTLTQNEVKEKIKEVLLSHQIGKAGYITASDISRGNDNIMLFIHPYMKEDTNVSKYAFAQQVANKKIGYFEYEWKNPNDTQNHLKALYSSYFEPWQWVINATSYKEEFNSLLDLTLFREYLDQAQYENDEGSYIAIFDLKGKLVYHPLLSGKNILDVKDSRTGEEFVKNLIETVKLKKDEKLVTGWLEYAFAKRGNLSAPSTDKILYYYYLPKSKWIVTTIVNKNEILKPYYKLRKELDTIGIGALFGLLFFALFSSRFVTNRLSHIIRATNQLAKNDYNIELKRRNNDEIGDLEDTFNTAAKKINTLINEQRKLNEKLEKKVEDRTKELKEKNKELQRLSTTDHLTRLYNRHKLDEALEIELARVKRYHHPLGVIILDIDHFKSVNDTYGHQVGDDVLFHIAKLLQEYTREIDIVGRWGGEEFLILCPETGLEGLSKLAEKLRKEIENFTFPKVGTKTASFGIAIYQESDSFNDLISKADEALYRAKENGRNRIES